MDLETEQVKCKKQIVGFGDPKKAKRLEQMVNPFFVSKLSIIIALGWRS